MDIMLRHYRRVAEIAGELRISADDVVRYVFPSGKTQQNNIIRKMSFKSSRRQGAALSDDITLIHWDYSTLEEESTTK